MEKITSLTINHLELLPDIYVSWKDNVGGATITASDIRMTRSNYEPVMNTVEVHTMEYLGVTFLRNHKELQDWVLYFGPMECWTGFYLLLAGDWTSTNIMPLVTEMFEFIRGYEGEVPGANVRDCGSYLDMGLPMTKSLADRFLKQVLYGTTEEHLVYPE